MKQYRKKPIVIEAVQFTGDVGLPEIVELDLPSRFDELVKSDVLDIATLEGTMTATPGDWIIRGVNGELYPCKDNIFQKSYDPA